MESRGWQGVWDVNTAYHHGAMGTSGGSVWHANIKSAGIRPGGNSAFWTLAVKRGKDAR